MLPFPSAMMMGAASAGVGPTPAYFAVSSLVTGSSSLNVTYPSSLQANDIAIIHAIVADSTNANSINVPTGFTQIDQRPIFSAADTTSSAGIFWKRLTGSESGTVTVSYTGALAGTDTCAAIMTIWRGCVTSGDPFEGAGYNIAGAVTSSMTGPAVTTTGSNRRIVHFGTTYSQSTCTAASGYSEKYDGLVIAGTAEGSVNCYEIERVSAGTESAAVHTLSTARRNQCFALALIPT